MKLSINRTIYRNRDIKIQLKKLKESGFDAIDFSVDKGYFELTGENWHEKTLEYADYAKKIGLEIYQTHLLFYDFMHNYDEDNEMLVKKGIEATALLGCKYAVLHPANPISREEDGLNATLAYFRKHMDYGYKFGVEILIENMRIQPKNESGYRFLSDAETLCEVADTLGIGICWDTGHANLFRDIDQREELILVGKRLKALHLNDNTGIDNDSHILPYTGTVPFDRIIPVLKEIGYGGTLNFELSNNNVPDLAIDSYFKYIYHVGLHFKRLLEI